MHIVHYILSNPLQLDIVLAQYNTDRLRPMLNPVVLNCLKLVVPQPCGIFKLNSILKAIDSGMSVLCCEGKC